jgi:predicted nicotinamide N-methyase
MRRALGSVVVERIEVGGRRLVIERPPSAEDLLDEEAFERDEFLPYWAELWPSGIALARQVATLALDGRRVLELGCGLGLPSIAAALAGADVLATDWSPDALAATRRNAALNGARVATANVRWEDPEALRNVDAFELVLAADVLYERDNGEHVLDLLERILASDGEALVADPGRPHAKRFLEAADTWRIERLERAELPRGGIYRLSEEIRLDRPNRETLDDLGESRRVRRHS